MTSRNPKTGSVYNCPNCGAAASPGSVQCAYCRSSLATLVCSKCYGAIFTGMKHCPWCGAGAGAGQPAGEAKHLCPRCRVPFAAIRVGKKDMAECTSCGGLWVTHETLQQICADQEQQQRVIGYDFEPRSPAGKPGSSSGRTYIPCPECGKLMNRRQFAGCSGVILDWCKAHGTWFDRNELKSIVEFIVAGGLARSREREKARLEEERQRVRDERRNLERLSRLGNDPVLSPAVEDRDMDVLGIMGRLWRSLN